MGFLISLLVGWGIPKKFAMPLAIAGLVVLGIGLFFGAKALYDHSIVSNYQNKVEASAAKADRKADQKAAEKKAEDLQRQGYEAEQLREAMENAPKNPAIDDRIERRVAFHRCLALQQRARANGLEPPRCV